MPSQRDREAEFFRAILRIDLRMEQDPTLPYSNFFRLLNVREDLDDSLALDKFRQLMAPYYANLQKVYNPSFTGFVTDLQRGVSHAQTAIFINEETVAAHRAELWEIRIGRLKEDAKLLIEGNMALEDATEVLKGFAKRYGFSPPNVDKAVREAADSVGPWPPSGDGPQPPPPPSDASRFWRPLVSPPISVPVGTSKTVEVPRWIWIPFLLLFGLGHLNAMSGLVLGILGGLASVPWMFRPGKHRSVAVSWSGSCLLASVSSLILSGSPIDLIKEGVIEGRRLSDMPQQGGPMDVGQPATSKLPDGPCQWLDLMIQPKTISSSGSRGDRGDNTTSEAQLAVDGDVSTAWAVAGDGKGQWIELGFGEDVEIDAVAILSCSQGSDQVDIVPGGIRDIQIGFGRDKKMAFSLEDQGRWQLIPFGTCSAESVRIDILSVYAQEAGGGSHGVSEVWFYRSKKSSSQYKWSGRWDGDLGSLVFSQMGGWVTGSYDAMTGKGYIASRVCEDGVLRGTWSMDPTNLPPKEAGDLELTLSDAGNAFRGKLRYGSTGDWSDLEISGERPETGNDGE